MNKVLIMLMMCLIIMSSHAHAAEKTMILPTPVSDRTFQYLQMSKTFMGTPLEVDALVPYALFVIGEKESPELFIQATGMAYMIGQWSQESGTSVETVKQNKTSPRLFLIKTLQTRL